MKKTGRILRKKSSGVLKKLGCCIVATALVVASANFGFTPKSDSVKKAKAAADSTFTDLSQSEIVAEMGAGWNIGNQLEAYDSSSGNPSETAWGNPEITQSMFAAVREAGFKSVRIPVSYLNYLYADTNGTNGYSINSTWLARVKAVIDMALAEDLYVITNIHGDGYNSVKGGWLLCNGSDQTTIKAKYEAFWKIIATTFKDYDEHLIFESMNEEYDGTYENPNSTYYSNINDYNQIFVDTVRQAGGNNDKRWLLLPGWNTNINYTAENYGFEIPTDNYLSSSVPSGEKRIMISVHYYDPWNFCGEESSSVTQWGDSATDSSKIANWGDESYLDGQFQKLYNKFTSQGYPVVIGEYGSIDKNTYDSTNETCRAEFANKVCKYSVEYGCIPVYWDNGYTGDYGFALFDRSTKEVLHQEIIDGIMEYYGDGDTASDDTTEYVDIWSGSEDLGSWGNKVWDASVFEDVVTSSNLKLTITCGTADSWSRIQVIRGNWDNNFGEAYSQSVGTSTTRVSFDLTSEDVEMIKNYGLTIVGYNVTITGIASKGIMAHKLYSQSTSATNGKYSKRWVYLVPEDELTNISSADFTITRTSDSKKYTKNVKSCYKAISADSSTLSYDGYYWICYAMTGIPEDVELTGTCTVNEISE
ncbi:MAG: glycoside hydrolase family 5 protein [Lachnospiraceae bacterium]|nr:glycoside hydrolase family 5 protein [Lachnospiraceae bacterium]